MATSPFSQEMGSKGVHELLSSTNTLHQRLEESTSLLTMFWRAALPSSQGPALAGKVVRNQHRLQVLPPDILLPPWSAHPEVWEPNGQLGQRELMGVSLEGDFPMMADFSLSLTVSLRLPPTTPQTSNQREKGKDME